MTIKVERKPRGSYQHGNLPVALLAAAENILEDQGIQALTLRAVARSVGVSHTAPQNHFDDLTGLLSELAASGYQRFSGALQAAASHDADDPRSRNLKVGRAYVRFARDHPGLFTLMFRSERLDISRPNLRQAIEAARATLRHTALPAEQELTPLQMLGGGIARWSLIHGFAVLLIEGRLKGVMQAVPGGVDVDTLLDAVLDSSRVDATLSRC